MVRDIHGTIGLPFLFFTLNEEKAERGPIKFSSRTSLSSTRYVGTEEREFRKSSRWVGFRDFGWRDERNARVRIVFNKDKMGVGKFVLAGRKEICRREREGSSFLIARVLPTRRIRKLHSHVSAPPRDNLAS